MYISFEFSHTLPLHISSLCGRKKMIVAGIKHKCTILHSNFVNYFTSGILFAHFIIEPLFYFF